ncbi:MAG: hypothetical protein Q9200_007254 [Gallowayella weberi]
MSSSQGPRRIPLPQLSPRLEDPPQMRQSSQGGQYSASSVSLLEMFARSTLKPIAHEDRVEDFAFRPSYSHPPPHYRYLRRRCEESKETGRGNINNERIFIAASLYDPEGKLVGGDWGSAVLKLVELLGPENVHLSVYEDDASPQAKAALEAMQKKISAEVSLVAEHLPLDDIHRVTTPSGQSKMKRIAFLAEVRNRALRPLQAKQAVQFDKLLYINDIIFDPIDAVNLLFSTNYQYSGRTQYQAACAVDFINPFKFYDRFALRDFEGYTSGIPFFPWFTGAGQGISRRDVLAQKDAVRVRACWGGMVAFEAKWFQNSYPGETANASLGQSEDSSLQVSPLRFRHQRDTFWEASECCLIHADLTYLTHGSDITDDSGIFLNPYIRVAYDGSTLRWLPYTRRVERLYTWVHSLLDHVVGMPQYNPRRLHRPGDEVSEKVWHYDETNGQSENYSEGSYKEIKRTVSPGRFCDIRRLMVMNRNPPKGQKNWENVPLPPEF